MHEEKKNDRRKERIKMRERKTELWKKEKKGKQKMH